METGISDAMEYNPRMVELTSPPRAGGLRRSQETQELTTEKSTSQSEQAHGRLTCPMSDDLGPLAAECDLA